MELMTIGGVLMGSLLSTTPSPLTSPLFEPQTTVEERLFIENTESTLLLAVPYIHQREDLPAAEQEIVGNTACGPAALAMLLQHKGLPVTLSEVIHTLPRSVYQPGDQFYDLHAGGDPFGFTSRVVDISAQGMYETLKKGHPITLNIQNYDGIVGHAVVVIGITGYDPHTQKADALLVHDPFRRSIRTFRFLNANTLIQPEGFITPIGSLQPFYLEEMTTAEEGDHLQEQG